MLSSPIYRREPTPVSEGPTDFGSWLFCRSVYDNAATFTDEIDTYTLDKWQVGTAKLFVGKESHVDLVGEVVASNSEVTFRFDEILAFNIPLHPKV